MNRWYINIHILDMYINISLIHNYFSIIARFPIFVVCDVIFRVTENTTLSNRMHTIYILRLLTIGSRLDGWGVGAVRLSWNLDSGLPFWRVPHPLHVKDLYRFRKKVWAFWPQQKTKFAIPTFSSGSQKSLYWLDHPHLISILCLYIIGLVLVLNIYIELNYCSLDVKQ